MDNKNISLNNLIKSFNNSPLDNNINTTDNSLVFYNNEVNIFNREETLKESTGSIENYNIEKNNKDSSEINDNVDYADKISLINNNNGVIFSDNYLNIFTNEEISDNNVNSLDDRDNYDNKVNFNNDFSFGLQDDLPQINNINSVENDYISGSQFINIVDNNIDNVNNINIQDNLNPTSTVDTQDNIYQINNVDSNISNRQSMDNNSIVVNNNNNNINLDNTSDIVDIQISVDNKENIDNGNNNNVFRMFIANKKVLMFLVIGIFIFTSITVIKTFYLRSMVNDYEEFFVEIEEKESKEAVVYMGNELGEDSLKNVAASEYINCINSSIDINGLPSSINSVIEEINNYYNRSNNYFSFKYKDIYTGFSVSYNETQNIFTASTIKAPKDIYIYEMASQGKINLDEEIMYTSRYSNTGAWVLNNKRFNTKHKVRDLVKYSTVSSDNAAHNMLMDHFGRENMLKFWTEKGTAAIFTANNNWGLTNAHDATIYMEELYKFYLENEQYGDELMNNFLNANPKFIKGKNNYKVANKSGWAGSAVHDVSIVFADNPYIVVALSNLGETDYYMSYFNKANDLAYKLHTEYWKYKMESCGNINQY